MSMGFQVRLCPNICGSGGMSDVGVFIDWENLYISCRESLAEDPRIYEMQKWAESKGRVTIMRAYGDLEDLKDTLNSEGIDPIVVRTRDRNGIAVKNAVDVHMVVDSMEAVEQYESMETVILVTGDQDFIPLVNSLRRKGKKTVVLGPPGSTSERLSRSADEYLGYFQLIGRDYSDTKSDTENQDVAGEEIDSTDKSETDDEYSERWNRIVGVTKKILDGSEEMEGSTLRDKLNAEFGYFEYSEFGVKKFSDFARNLEQSKALSVVTGVMQLKVRPYGVSTAKGKTKKAKKNALTIGNIIGDIVPNETASDEEIRQCILEVLANLPYGWPRISHSPLKSRTITKISSSEKGVSDAEVDRVIIDLLNRGEINREAFSTEKGEQRTGYGLSGKDAGNSR
jgi:uncharacterized protein (TIGR00288 family)